MLCPGVLLSLPDGLESIRDGISRLCESWWTSGLQGRDDLAPQMLAYLLQRCLEPAATVIAAALLSDHCCYNATTRPVDGTGGHYVFVVSVSLCVCAQAESLSTNLLPTFSFLVNFLSELIIFTVMCFQQVPRQCR